MRNRADPANAPPGEREPPRRAAASSTNAAEGDSTRAACPCGGRCPRCTNAAVLPPLAIGVSNGVQEQSADAAADAAISENAAAALATPPPPIQEAPQAPATNATTAPDSVSRTVGRAGAPLPTKLGHHLGDRFGRDLSSVRVHTDGEAARSADDVDADAYAVGQHVVFARGQYDPQTTPGQHLIAHEVAHTLQQRGTTQPHVQRKPRGEKRKSVSDLVDDAFGYLAEKSESMRQDSHARSIVFDFVRPSLVQSYRFSHDSVNDSVGDSKLTTETYYIIVKQKPDPKHPDATQWLAIVDRTTRFNLHHKITGTMQDRNFARIANSTDGKRPLAVIKGPAVAFGKPDASVVFDAPTTAFARVAPTLGNAPSYFDYVAKEPLLNLAESPISRVRALESLYTGKPPVDDPPARVHQPRPAPPKPPTPPRKQIDQEEDVPGRKTPAPKPILVPGLVNPQVPMTPSTPTEDLVDSSRSKDGDEPVTVEQSIPKEKEKEDDEDHWYDGLLRALEVLAEGLTILLVVALAVAGAVFLLTGGLIVMTAAAAIAVAGAMLLSYGVYEALGKRLNQKEFAGRPGAAIGRAFLDAVGVTGIQELISGEDAVTHEKLTPGQQAERGFLGGVNILALLWGAKGASKSGPKAKPRVTPDAVPHLEPVDPLPAPTPGIEPAPIKPVPIDPAPTRPPPVTPEPVPIEPAPIEPAPVAPAPVEPAPMKPAPVEPTPIDPAPVEPTPVEPVPVEPSAVEPIPTEPVPANPVPADPVPDAPTPDTTPDTTPPPKRRRGRKAEQPVDPDASTPKTRKRVKKTPPVIDDDPAAQAKKSKKTPSQKTDKPVKPVKPTLPAGDPLHTLRTAIDRIKEAIKGDYTDLDTIRPKRDAARQALKDLEGQSPKASDKVIDRARAKVQELEAQYDFRADELAKKARIRDRYVKALDGQLYDRPSYFSDAFVQAVWDAAKDENGRVFSPSGTEIKPGDPWVMGHEYGYEFWKHQLSAARRLLSRDGFLREFYDIKKFRPETVTDNSSHKYEAPDNVYKGK